MLNAFRHQRFDTHRRRRLERSLLSAQRLSASEIRHADDYGLIDQFIEVLNAFRHQRFDTQNSFKKSPLREVLNAFRHQRFDTWIACGFSASSFSAQRLSASEIRHIRQLVQAFRTFARAQRLSASEIRHQIIECCKPIIARVLNAFRHQRFDTTVACLKYRGKNVLNAFRHQRFDTPSSDDDIRTKLVVLNAFRHQRFDTLIADDPRIVSNSAQRLSASEIRHDRRGENQIGYNCAQRLSASEIRHKFGTYHSLIFLRAQRLSASEIRHEREPVTRVPALPKCSTPFGIRDSTLDVLAEVLSSLGSAQRLSASEIRH